VRWALVIGAKETQPSGDPPAVEEHLGEALDQGGRGPFVYIISRPDNAAARLVFDIDIIGRASRPVQEPGCFITM
jgi:hypothetical protein